MPRRSSPRAIAAASAVLAALGACETTTIYIERPASTTGSTSTTTTSSSSTSSGMGGTGGASLCIPGTTQPCYDGPAGTEGQGICKSGAQACASDGMSWGPCTGAVLPQVENCATPEDEDCDGKAPPCKGNLLWAKRFGDSSNQYAAGLAVDPSTSLVLTGNFSGSLSFGGATLVSAGDADVFVAKLDSSGNHLWSLRFGNSGYQAGYGVAADAAGNVIVTGTFSGAVDFGGGALMSSGPGDVFVVKLDPSGQHIWSRRFGTASGQIGYGVAGAPDGSVLLTGVFYGAIDFGGGSLMSTGAGDIFLAKLDAAGNHLWSRRFGDQADQTAYGVATDALGNVIITGTCGGVVDFGAGPLSGAGGGDVFIAKLDVAGSHVWSRRYGDAGDQIGYSVAVDGAGGVVVAGALYGSADFGGGSLVSAGGSDLFAVKLDAAGNHVWSRRFGDSSDQIAYSVAADASGSTVLTGAFNGLVDFDGGPLTSAGNGDVFVAKLDGAGQHLWSRRAGAAGTDIGNAIDVDATGNIVVAGTFAAMVDFGGGPLMSAGGSDVFVARFAP